MLLFIAIPVFVAVGAFQRYLAIYAPTNVLIRRVRSSPAHIGTALELAALATVLLVAMRGVQLCIRGGAPDWLNLITLILAWDALKISLLMVVTACRWGARLMRGWVAVPITKPHQTGSSLG